VSSLDYSHNDRRRLDSLCKTCEEAARSKTRSGGSFKKKSSRSSSKEVGDFWMRTVRVLDDFGTLRFAAMHNKYWGYGYQGAVRLG
jgi:transcriptional regulator NrdR family protein